MQHHVVAIRVEGRAIHAQEVQRILTEHGCMIHARLGIHGHEEGTCSSSGLIILQVVETELVIREFLIKLNALEQVTAKQMSI